MGVNGLRGNPATVAWLVNDFKLVHKPAAAQLITLGLGDQFIADYFTPFIADAVLHLRYTLYEDLASLIGLRVLQANFHAEYRAGPLEAMIESVDCEFPRGIEFSQPAFGQTEIGTKWMHIWVDVLISAPSTAEAALWEIGFVQTVMRLERNIVWETDDGKLVRYRARTDGPTKDGPAGYTGPWYDNPPTYPVVVELKPELFQKVSVKIKDRPSFSFSPPSRRKLKSITGGESFKTWIALRKKDGSQTVFLRMWEWHVEYTIDWKEIPEFGIVLDGVEQNATGMGALMDGKTTKDSIRSDQREESARW